MPVPEPVATLLRGPLCAAGTWPLFLACVCGDLRRAFLPKGRVGTHYRAIARNGRVLLASDVSLDELGGRAIRARFQTWHRAILPLEAPAPYGLLLCLWGERLEGMPLYETRLVPEPGGLCDLAVAVGGLRLLEVRALS